MAEVKERVRVVLPATVQESESGKVLRSIAEAASNPYCDAEKMKALHELMKDVYEFEGRRAFTRAFNALQAELPAITRDGRIDHSADGGTHTRSGKRALKTAYATYPNIMRVVGPLLKKNGFTLSNVIEPSPDGARINVVGYLEHIDGHSRISRFPMGIDASGGKNNQQGWGSAQSYASRYNAIALLNIVSEAAQDQDNDGFKRSDFPGDQVAVVSEEQLMQLRDAVEGNGVPLDKVLAKYNIAKLIDLPAARFSDVISACKSYGEQKRAS